MSSASATRMSCSLRIRERHATLGIDFVAVPGTPGDEVIRLDYGSNDDVPDVAQMAFAAFGNLLPAVIRPGQLFRVVHDFENARIVAALVPCDADCAFHFQSPVAGVATATVGASARADNGSRAGVPAQ